LSSEDRAYSKQDKLPMGPRSMELLRSSAQKQTKDFEEITK